MTPEAVVEPVYLDKLALSGSHGTLLKGKQTIRGEDYLRSLYLCSELSWAPNINCDSEETEVYYVEYATPKAMHRFRVTIGLSDLSPSTCKVQAKVAIANGMKFDQELVVGAVYDRTWTVTAGNRIRLSIQPLPGGGRCRTVFGDARLEP